MLIYSIYIYFMVLMSIVFKPTPFLLTLVALYVFTSSVFVYNYGNCSNPYKYTWILVYSLVCTFMFYATHVLYQQGRRIIFLLYPFIYFCTVKCFESYFKCDKNTVLKFMTSF